jgi:AcrR family transcriptional regulator
MVLIEKRKPGRPPKKLLDGQSVRDALLLAAAAEFNESGYHSTDTNRIAKRAGLAPATFYNYFATKRDAFIAVYERWVSHEWKSLSRLLSTTPSGPEQLSKVATLVIRQHKTWRVFRHSLSALAQIDPEVHEAKLAQQALQIEHLLKLKGPNLDRSERARALNLLLVFEAVCDGIANGHYRHHAIPETLAVGFLADEVSQFLAA